MISLSDGIWGEFFGFFTLYFSVLFLNLKFILKGVNLKAFMTKVSETVSTIGEWLLF